MVVIVVRTAAALRSAIRRIQMACTFAASPVESVSVVVCTRVNNCAIAVNAIAALRLDLMISFALVVGPFKKPLSCAVLLRCHVSLIAFVFAPADIPAFDTHATRQANVLLVPHLSPSRVWEVTLLSRAFHVSSKTSLVARFAESKCDADCTPVLVHATLDLAKHPMLLFLRMARPLAATNASFRVRLASTPVKPLATLVKSALMFLASSNLASSALVLV